MNHQLTDTKALTALDPAGPLPDWLAALNVPADQIRDLTWTGRTDQGFWPVEVAAPAFDPETEALTEAYASYTVDGAAKVWRAVLAKRPLTPEEIAARNPVPESVSLRFWRTALKLWKTDDGSTRFVAVEAAIAAVEKVGSVYGLIAREAFEYANTVDRPTLLAMKDVFGFTAGEVDESLWRADRIGHNDFSGVWPLPTA